MSGLDLPIYGSGLNIREWVHVSDHARAIAFLAMSGNTGEIYNVGPKKPTPIAEVVERTAIALGLTLEDICVITEDRLGQDSKYWLDSSKIESQLGWKQKIKWDDGLREMVNWGERYKHTLMKMKPDYIMRA